jgi:hypothetical protein
MFTVLIYWVYYARSYSVKTYLSMTPIILGVGLTTFGDYYFTVYGFTLTLLGVILAAVKVCRSTANVAIINSLLFTSAADHTVEQAHDRESSPFWPRDPPTDVTPGCGSGCALLSRDGRVVQLREVRGGRKPHDIHMYCSSRQWSSRSSPQHMLFPHEQACGSSHDQHLWQRQAMSHCLAGSCFLWCQSWAIERRWNDSSTCGCCMLQQGGARLKQMTRRRGGRILFRTGLYCLAM